MVFPKSKSHQLPEMLERARFPRREEQDAALKALDCRNLCRRMAYWRRYTSVVDPNSMGSLDPYPDPGRNPIQDVKKCPQT